MTAAATRADDTDLTTDEPTALGPRARNLAFAAFAGGMLLSARDSTIVATARCRRSSVTSAGRSI